MEISARFARIRSSIGLNKRQFAYSLGINQSVAGNIELGKREPSREVMLKLASIYNVNIHWFLTGKGSMFLSEVENIEDPSKKVTITINKSRLNNTENFGNVTVSHSKEQPGYSSTPIIEEVNRDELTTRNISVFEIPLLTKEQVLHFDPGREIPYPKAYSGNYPDYTLVPIPFRFREYSTDLRAIVVFNGLMVPVLNPGDVAIFQATGFNGDGVYIYRMIGDLHIGHVKFDGMDYRLTKEFMQGEEIPCDGGTFEAIGRVRAVVREIG
jgi:transcriptional regulator with XRE-family HTH domain